MRGNEFLNKHFNLLIKILIMKLLAKSKLVFYKLKNLFEHKQSDLRLKCTRKFHETDF